jgi:hypothetical protein
VAIPTFGGDCGVLSVMAREFRVESVVGKPDLFCRLLVVGHD